MDQIFMLPQIEGWATHQEDEKRPFRVKPLFERHGETGLQINAVPKGTHVANFASSHIARRAAGLPQGMVD
jgi:hypothetical protein